MMRIRLNGVRPPKAVVVSAVCLLVLWIRPCLGQANPQPIRSIVGSGGVRVVLPVSIEVDAVFVQRVLEAAAQQQPLRGFRTDVLNDINVTVSLVEKRREGYEAWTWPFQSVVVIASEDIALWDDDKLRRVIRHELVHVGMDRFLGGRQTPIWFREGFAEWAAGGLDCVGHVRLGLNILTRNTDGFVLEELDYPNQVSRGAYDLYASFFDFIEGRYPGPLEDGTLLVAVREGGVRDGIEHTFGKTVEELEGEWQQYLFAVYVEGAIPNCTIAFELN